MCFTQVQPHGEMPASLSEEARAAKRARDALSSRNLRARKRLRKLMSQSSEDPVSPG